MEFPECLSSFSQVVRDWFLENIGEPSEPQARGWPEIAAGNNVLICAPTGSGKTFAAFLKCLDVLYAVKTPGSRNTGVKIVYVSPLKALNNDIYRNLELPLGGIREKAESLGMVLPEVSAAVRTGDTPRSDRSRMLKHPPDILITTPESLFIMLTSESSRNIFSTADYLIIDEIHSICANKRGVHLALSVERLERIAGKPLKRIGLSATINPLEEAAKFLAGCTAAGGGESRARPVSVINCDRRRRLELSVSLPVRDLKVLPYNTVWPSIYAQLLALIKEHKSTLIFVNNRKAAELVAAGLNRLADEPFVKTHHGSISKEVRQQLEKQLKEGEINCLVATSSLELGIDIGSIELVVQVSAPGSVSQVLQRIGRSGHRLESASKGIIIPKTRGDLLSGAFISNQAGQYNIENIRVPANCLDVLAQQVVSIACEGGQSCMEIYDLVRRSYPFMTLPLKQFEDVLEMLADPSPENPGAVKPRIAWEKGTGKIRGTAAGRHMCLMSGGTIPDKGNYAVYLKDTGLKLGELQEEFVFESMPGDRFFLGSSVWRLEKIEKDRVIVSQSSDSGAKIPFWLGDQVLRTYETGLKLGTFLQKLERGHMKPDFYEWAEKECGLDRTSAENLKQYIADQLSVTGRLPCDKLIICEHFSDDVGDRRIMIHSPFGGRVHAPLAVILHSKLSGLLNCRIEYVHNDDGILFHIVGYTGKPANIFKLLSVESLEDDIFGQLPDAPLFNINLRYNLMRSLLVSTGGFGKRTPLWIQRIRCAEAAQFVLTKPDHPVAVETYRECMNDIFDIRSLYLLVDGICKGTVKVLDVYTEKPSPFSTELIFNFWQVFQYTYDLPAAERRNQLLVNDRDFIQLAVGVNGEYDLIDPRAVDKVVSELNNYKYGFRFKDEDELYYFVHSFGELEAEPYSSTMFRETDPDFVTGLLSCLEEQGRILRISINGSGGRYWIAAEDYPLYCRITGNDMLTSKVTVGFPGNESEMPAPEWLNSYILKLDPDETDAAVRILRRHIMYTGPFTSAALTARYEIREGLTARAIARLLSAGEIVKLKESDAQEDVIYCHSKVYGRIKRKTVMLARSDMKPRDPEDYCSFLFERHGLGEDVLPPDEKLEASVRVLQGMFLPVGWWEDFVFPSRVGRYDPKLLDYLCATGVVRWIGRMNGNTKEAAFTLPHEQEEREKFNVPADAFTMDGYEEKIIAALRDKGACFLKELSKHTGLDAAGLLAKLERLVFCGTVSNDAFSVARYYTDIERKNSPFVRYNTYPNMGRWYLVENSSSHGGSMEILAYINRLLDRYGIISKDIANCEKTGFKWGEIYNFLKNNEFESGIKRGFYVNGLAGVQFAMDREIDHIRMQDSRGGQERYLTLCSCDPANSYKDILSKSMPGRAIKNQGTAVVFRNGRPVLAVRDYGGSILPLVDDIEILEKAAGNFIESFNSRLLWAARKNIVTEYWGNAGDEQSGRINDSPIYDKLLELGYDRGYNGITFWRRAM